MKIIHCADCHLDSAMTSLFSEEEAERRRGEIRETFLKLISQASEDGVEAILIAGDLFDTEKVQSVTANYIRDAVQKHPEIMFYYLAGNHDAYGFEIEEENFKTFTEDWRTYRLGNVTISGMENPGHLQAERLSLPEETFNIVMLHGDIENDIAVDTLKDKKISYMALGHIHKGYDAYLGGDCLMSYPGCLEGRGFDETGVHGYNLLEIHEGDKTFQKTFVPFAGRQIFILPCDVSGTETTPEMEERLRETLKAAGVTSRDLVRCLLRGEVSAEAEKNLPALEAFLERQTYKAQLKDETTLHVSYAVYRNDLSLKGEFIRMMEDTDTYTEADKAAIIRCGLGLLKGEAVERCI